MPYVSEAQRGYFHAHKAELESQGVDVGEWDRASKGKKLPKKKKQGDVLGSLGRRAALAATAPIDRFTQAADLVLSRLCGREKASGSVLDGLETPCGASHSEFPGPGLVPAQATVQASPAQPLYLTKVALACMRRDQLLVGPPRSAWLVKRGMWLKAALGNLPSAAPQAVSPVAADSVAMLHGRTAPNPQAAMAVNPSVNPQPNVTAPGGASNCVTNPINTYGPLTGGAIGGGMFGQKITETGSLKTSALWPKLAGAGVTALLAGSEARPRRRRLRFSEPPPDHVPSAEDEARAALRMHKRLMDMGYSGGLVERSFKRRAVDKAANYPAADAEAQDHLLHPELGEGVQHGNEEANQALAYALATEALQPAEGAATPLLDAQVVDPKTTTTRLLLEEALGLTGVPLKSKLTRALAGK